MDAYAGSSGYVPDSRSHPLKHPALYRVLGHKAATVVQYSVYAAEGIAKNTYNSAVGLRNWRTEEPNAERDELPSLTRGQELFYINNCYGNIEDAFNRPVYGPPDAWINVSVREPESSKGYFRRLRCTGRTQRVLNLGSYNYLGFGGVNEYCTPAVEEALEKYPVSTGSPSQELGQLPVHAELEDFVARFVGKEAALVVGMGFATNSTIIPALVGAGDLILSDSLNHNSIVEGARLSGAKVQPFRHNDAAHLEVLLQRACESQQPQWGRVMVVVEGIYSMEGELSRLPEIVAVAKRYGAAVYLDEAHSIGAVGATGRGVCEELGVDPADVDVMMGTFTKSFGAVGGYVAASAEIVAAVRLAAVGSTEAVSMAPACVVQCLTALRVIAGEDGTDIGAQKLKQLRENSAFFRAGLEAMGLEVLGENPSPIMPVMLYQPYKISDFSRLAFERKLAVVVVGYPATPLFYPRVRFCISAAHSRADLQMALDAVSEIADILCLRFKRAPALKYAPGSIHALEEAAVPKRRKDVKAAEANRERVLANIPRWRSLGRSVGSAGASTAAVTAVGVVDDPSMALSQPDYHRFSRDADVRAASLRTVRELGCGSCSPRGFYGTFAPHLKLEEEVASFLGLPEALLYPFGACTISSVLPAIVQKTDVVIADEGCAGGVRAGLRLCKARVLWYRHGDAAHAASLLHDLELETAAAAMAARAAGQRQPAGPEVRRFLVTEAVFGSTGRIAPLRELLTLKARHKLRIVLEETHSFGVLGATGKGLLEHLGLPSKSVDAIAASTEPTLGSIGGFCAGCVAMVAPQRLLGAGYVFSASLPPYLASASLQALQLLREQPERVEKLQAAAARLREAALELPHLTTRAAAGSPCVPLTLRKPSGDAHADQATLDSIAAACRARGVAVVRAQGSGIFASSEAQPHLRCFATSGGDVRPALAVVAEEALRVFGPASLAAALTPEPSPSKFDEIIASPEKPASAAKRQLSFAADEEQLSSSKAAASAAESSTAAAFPLAIVLGFLVQRFRQYLVGQSRTTTGFVPGMLEASGVYRSPLMRSAVWAAGAVQSQSFFEIVGPALVWGANCALAQVLVILYCLNCVVGCWLKALVATHGGKARERHGWPSISCANATALPFFILRWRYGDRWVWEQPDWFPCVLEHGLAFAALALAILARLRQGDSPANVQGGVAVGAFVLRCVVPYADRLALWLANGGGVAALATSREGVALLAITAALMLTFPLRSPPAFASTQPLLLRSACTLSFLLSFTAAALCVPRALTVAPGWLAARLAVGFTLVALALAGARTGLAKALKSVKAPPAVAAHAMTVVPSAAFGAVVAGVAPALFQTLAI